MPIIQATPPSEEPVSLAEARLQCRYDDDITEHDSQLEALIKAATEYCENYTCRPLITQEKKYMGPFKKALELTANLLSVESISYIDTSGAAQNLPNTEYYVDTASLVGRLTPYEWWPSVKSNHPQPVTINFTCGYGAAEDVPEAIKQAIKLLVAHWNENPNAVAIGAVSSELEFSVSALLNPYRVHEI